MNQEIDDDEVIDEEESRSGMPLFRNKADLKRLGKKFAGPLALILNLVKVVLLIFVIYLFYGILNKPDDRWEYKQVRYKSSEFDREGYEALKQTGAFTNIDELDDLGNRGWELVSCSIEMETAFPNFGNGEYVTGIKSNVRPHGVLLIFKRKL